MLTKQKGEIRVCVSTRRYLQTKLCLAKEKKNLGLAHFGLKKSIIYLLKKQINAIISKTDLVCVKVFFKLHPKEKKKNKKEFRDK